MLSVASLYLRWWLLAEQEEILGKRVAWREKISGWL